MTRRLALITGASAGIGAEFARQYAARGWDVALTARRADRLEALALDLEKHFGCSTLVIAQDLAGAQAVDAILAEVKEAGRHVDGLVNNAGYGLPGTFFNTSWADQETFIRVLFTAPCELVHKLLPGMSERNYGRIVNVASLVGYTPGSAGHTLYAPVKAAMIKFSESVHAEAKAAGHDIHVTALCPGLTWTEFHDVNGTRARTNQAPAWMWMQAGPVVEAGIDAVERGMPVVVPGGQNKGLATLAKLLPDPIARMVMAEQSKRFRDLKD
ncbi:MAG: SDR family oxidoreductase [Hyphomonadaceae bacterium]|nr:SDR family oxidoreductase [Hyphomonadaceae bacterium]